MSRPADEKARTGRSLGIAAGLALLFALAQGAEGLQRAIAFLSGGEAIRAIDHLSFHYAADAVFNRGLSPYAGTTAALYAAELGERVFPFLYPPYALPLLYPLSWGDHQTGAALGILLNTALAAGLYLVLHRMFLGGLGSRAALLAAFVFALAFNAVEETIHLGQVNLPAAIAMLLAWHLLREGRAPWGAGLLIGVAILVKTYFALFLLPLLIQREFRPVLAAAAVVLALSALSLAALPAGLWGEWAELAAARGGFGRLAFPEFPQAAIWNQSVNGIAIRIFGPGAPAGLAASGGAVLVLAASAWRLWTRRAAPSRDFHDSSFVLMACVTFLVAPLSWNHHLVFLLGPLLCLWQRAEVIRHGRAIAIGFGAIALVMAVQWPLIHLYPLWPGATSLPFAAVLLLWALCLTRSALPWKSASRPVYVQRQSGNGAGASNLAPAPQRAGGLS